jgi:hypothetical protein
VKLADVGDPTQIRPLGGEVALQQVRGRDHLVVPVPPFLAGMGADQPIVTHESGDAMTPNPMPAPAKLTEHTWRSVRAAGLLMDLADLIEQRRVRDRTRRLCQRLPRVEPGSAHSRDVTQVRDPAIGSVIVNEPEADHRFVLLREIGGLAQDLEIDRLLRGQFP